MNTLELIRKKEEKKQRQAAAKLAFAKLCNCKR
jgi:hypothetical protein